MFEIKHPYFWCFIGKNIKMSAMCVYSLIFSTIFNEKWTFDINDTDINLSDIDHSGSENQLSI